MATKEDKIKEKLLEDPGNPVFAEFAEYLRRKRLMTEAMGICLSGLSANPSCHPGRLVLARIYYSLSYMPFASRELEALLTVFPEDQSLRRLVLALNPTFTEIRPDDRQLSLGGAETLIAETAFDMGDLDLLDE
jgi:hypothetical protein